MEKKSLPTKKSEIDLNFTSQKFGMMGQSGIGKSDFWAQDEKVFFIETEAGLNFQKVFKLPARSWQDLRDIYALLREQQIANTFPYSIVVIDTVDRFVELAEEEIVQRAKIFYKNIASEINTINDVPNGGGWSKTRELVMNYFNYLEMLPCAVGFVSHLSIKRIEKGMQKYDKSTISLWAGVGNDIMGWADHLLHVEAHMIGDKLVRTVYTMPTQTREAKSRGGVVPDGLRWGEDSKANYAEFRKLFV